MSLQELQSQLDALNRARPNIADTDTPTQLLCFKEITRISTEIQKRKGMLWKTYPIFFSEVASSLVRRLTADQGTRSYLADRYLDILMEASALASNGKAIDMQRCEDLLLAAMVCQCGDLLVSTLLEQVKQMWPQVLQHPT